MFKKVLAAALFSVLAFADMMTVEKVIDGDTVYFRRGNEEVKCRIAYIDTPESRSNEKLGKDMSNCHIVPRTMIEAGKEAKNFTANYFRKGSKHDLTVIDTDRYGRSVCKIGEFNSLIVRSGYAYPYWRYIPSGNRREFKIALDEAKRNKAGLWSSHEPIMRCMEKARE